jgi:DNA-binding beta-propeller fold protein YncE
MSSLSFTPTYRWEQVPRGLVSFDATDIAVDADDRVYVLGRREARVYVYEASGASLDVWEDSLSADPHGLTFGPDGNLYCADRGDNAVRVFAPDGKLLTVVGPERSPSETGGTDYRRIPSTEWAAREPAFRSGPPYNGPTKVAVHPDGRVYVADGYGNSRIHRFDANHELEYSWGEPGGAVGQFRLPHSVCLTADDRLLVADRENSRIQLFKLDGTPIEAWDHVNRPLALAVDAGGNVYVGEGSTRTTPARLSVLDPSGSVLFRVEGHDDYSRQGAFNAIHGLAVDSQGDIYFCENNGTRCVMDGRPFDPSIPTLQKWRRN